MSSVAAKHSHYHKDVSGLTAIDVYRVLSLFNVTDPCIQHAIKKLLVAGGRGAGKDIDKDIQESIDSLVRWKEIRQEDSVRLDPGFAPAPASLAAPCLMCKEQPCKRLDHCPPQPPAAPVVRTGAAGGWGGHGNRA